MMAALMDHRILRDERVTRWDQTSSDFLLVVFWQQVGRTKSVRRGLVRRRGEIDV